MRYPGWEGHFQNVANVLHIIDYLLGIVIRNTNHLRNVIRLLFTYLFDYFASKIHIIPYADKKKIFQFTDVSNYVSVANVLFPFK